MKPLHFFWSRPAALFILFALLVSGGWAGWKSYDYSRNVRWQGEPEACRTMKPEDFPLHECVVRIRLDNLRGDWGGTFAIGLRRYYYENEPLSCYVQSGWLPDKRTLLIYTMANCGERMAMAMAQRFVADYNSRYNSPTLSVDQDQNIAAEDYARIPYAMIWGK